MRVVGLLLALAVSPLGVTVCQLTCATHAAAHQHRAGASSHESLDDDSAAAALKVDGSCQHHDEQLVLANMLPAYQLAVTSAPLFQMPTIAAPRPISFAAAALASISPPPLLLPLRI
jgi:hypothetical protein